jgi:hypothetical protein
MEKPPFSVGIIEPTPNLVDQFFNASTGESRYGEADFVGPWNHANGLVPMESEIKGGEGLDVTPYDPQPGSQKPFPSDSTPVGEFTNGVGKKQAAIPRRSEGRRRRKTPPLRCRVTFSNRQMPAPLRKAADTDCLGLGAEACFAGSLSSAR